MADTTNISSRSDPNSIFHRQLKKITALLKSVGIVEGVSRGIGSVFLFQAQLLSKFDGSTTDIFSAKRVKQILKICDALKRKFHGQ